MKVPRMSIRGLAFGTFLVAGNFAALRLARGFAPIGLEMGLLGILPVSNILVVSCYRRLTSRTPASPFFVGFGLSGALAMLAWFNLMLTADEGRLQSISNWIASILENFDRSLNISMSINNESLKMAYFVFVNWFVFLCLTALPLLLVALVGGWIAGRIAAMSRQAHEPRETPACVAGG